VQDREAAGVNVAARGGLNSQYARTGVACEQEADVPIDPGFAR
jgi:hypothetical protein